MVTTLEQITPTQSDVRSASELNQALARLVDARHEIRFRTAEADAEEITLPPNLAKFLYDVLAHVAQGQTVTVLPAQAELTTHQAADQLGVSRPHLIKLLNSGEIAFRQVGTKRRIPLTDLMRYREENKARRLNSLATLQAQAQELDMGY